MAEKIRFVPAATWTLDAFAAIFTSSFEAYFYPGTTTGEILARRIRLEQLDLLRSVVLLVDDEPAGQAVLGLRDRRAWCGGFGISLAYRGRGLAHGMGQALIAQARASGATQLGLEVLTRNTPAIRTYTSLGLGITRDLVLLEWTAPKDTPGAEQASTSPISPRAALEHFDRLHPTGAAWQRDLPSLLIREGLEGLALQRAGQLAAYVLYSVRDTGARIEDLGAEHVEDAAALLGALQARYERLLTVNEPGDSPITAAFAAASFREIDRQHEMSMAL